MESLNRAIKNELDISIGKSNVDLIIDVGLENNSQTIREFIKSQKVKITKKNVLKDVLFLNSIVERTYSILKVIQATFKSFRTIAGTMSIHYQNILNYFDNRSINTSAESFNAKIKVFEDNSRYEKCRILCFLD